MKQHMRILALVLAAILWSSLLPVAVAESYTGTINTDKVFFRMKASTEAGYYCKLEKKTKVTVTGVLFQPKPFAAGAREPVIVGLTVSRFTVTELFGPLLPSASVSATCRLVATS